MANEFDGYSGKRSMAALNAGLEIVNLVVQHDDFQLACEKCLEIIPTMVHLSFPVGVLIYGASGTGKTLLLNTLDRRLSAHFTENRPGATCLKISLDASTDLLKVAIAFARALGYPILPSRPTLENVTFMVDKALERKRTIALMIDEMQHICEGNRDITAKTITDWLKVRMDKHNLPFVGAGTEAIQKIPDINPQFVSRASSSFSLYPFQPGAGSRNLLSAFVDNIKMVSLEILLGPAGKILISNTKGIFRSIKRILVFSVMHAMDRGSTALGIDDLEKAYLDAAGGSREVRNPFAKPS